MSETLLTLADAVRVAIERLAQAIEVAVESGTITPDERWDMQLANSENRDRLDDCDVVLDSDPLTDAEVAEFIDGSRP